MATRVTSSRLVGRSAELAQLAATLTDAAGGRATLAFVAGDSGVGKTRLVHALEEHARDAGAVVLHGDAFELGEGELPYAPLVGALRPLARSGGEALDAIGPASRAELARLLPALGAPDATPLSQASGGAEGAAQGRLFEAILELLGVLGDQDEPALLVLEDLHWADASTRAFVAFLARSLCREHVLVVGTYRADELHRRHPLRPLLAELERDPAIARVVLPALTRDEVRDALEDILGAPPAGPLLDRLYTRSEGNPLFVEELLAAAPDGRGALPATLRDALMVRIERLGENTQEVLRVVAVAQRAGHDVLAEASGLDAAALRVALRDAIANHLLVADDEDGAYLFRHALLREVVEDDLLPGEREGLHLALAHALERRRGGAQRAAGIAFHYAAAGEQREALAASISAAREADAVHAHREAASLLERALELWPRVPDAEELAGMDRVALLQQTAASFSWAGEHARAESLLRAALDLADERRDPACVASILERMAQSQWRLGRSDDAQATARRALAIVGRDASPERARLLSWWAKTRMLQGRYRDGARAGADALAAAEAVGDDEALLGALNALGFALISQGEIAEGEAHMRRAMDLARATDRPNDLQTAATNLSDALHIAGRLDEARRVAHEGFEEAARMGLRSDWLGIGIAELAIEAGDLAEADGWLPGGDRRFAGLALVNVELRRTELALARGQHDAAAASLTRIQPLVADSGEAQFHGAYGAALAELRRRQGDLDAARAAVDEALDRIEFCTDDAMRLSRVAAIGVGIEADRAQRGRDLGDREEIARGLAGADDLLLRVEGAAAEGRPLETASLREAEANRSRAAGADDPGLWDAAASAWADLGRALPELAARWHQAEALVVRDDREAAARVVGPALERARAIGATWIEGELEGLCARARLRLDAHEGPGAAAAPAESDGAGDPDDDPFGLTPRERQVLELVARGATNREIGAELFMAEKTASVHVSRILAKLDVRSRTQAAAVAHRLGLAG